jgi:hypothetical protein
MGSAVISFLQTALHVLGIITTVVTMLKSKGTDTKSKMDEETGTRSDNKRKRISCGSCGQLTSPNKVNGNTKPIDDKKLDGKSTADADAEPGDIKPKLEEPHVDTETIKSIVKQSKALYAALQLSSDSDDISHYGEHDLNSANGDIMDVPQTGYADVDMNNRQYDDIDMQAFQ